MNSIHINPENKGKFKETMRRTGKSKEELSHSKNPLTRKRAIFAINASKWNKKELGGLINLRDNNIMDVGGPIQATGPLVGLDNTGQGMTYDNALKELKQPSLANIQTKGLKSIGSGLNDAVGSISGAVDLVSDIITPNNTNPLNTDGTVSLGNTEYKDVSNIKANTVSGGDQAKQALGNAGKGAAIGMTVGGPIGAAIGGVIGGVGTALKNIFGNKKAKRKAEEARDNATMQNSRIQNNTTLQKTFAEGGDLNTFNEGGSHEESILGGIPQGFDSNGNPNLVEEGETRFQDYIFSDRLLVSSDIVNQLGLPKKLIGKSYAEASELLYKEREERPNDPISQKGFDESMTRLMAANNMAQDIADEEARIEDENMFMEGGSLGRKPKEVPQDKVNELAQSFAGKEKLNGGVSDRNVRELSPELFDSKEIEVGIKVEMEHTNDPKKAREIALDHLAEDPDYYTKLYNAGLADENLSDNDIEVLTQKDAELKEGIRSNMFDYGGFLDNNNGLFKALTHNKNLIGKDKVGNPINRNKKQSSSPMTRHTVEEILDFFPNKNDINIPFRPKDINYSETKNPITTRQVNTTNRNIVKSVPEVLPTQKGEAFTNKKPTREAPIVNPNKSIFTGLKNNSNGLLPLELDRIKSQEYNNGVTNDDNISNNRNIDNILGYLDYIAPLGNIIAASTIGKPEVVNGEYLTPELINDYLSYNPIGRDRYLNPIIEESANYRRALTGAAGGDRAAILAGLQGINASSQDALARAALQAELENEQRRIRSAEFNRGISQYNASEKARVDQYNSQLKMQLDELNAQNKANRRNAIRQYLMGAASNLSAIGKEARNRNLVKTMGLDYYIDALNRVKHKNE